MNNMETEMKKILDEIREIKVDINFIKSNMVDVDCILTKDDLNAIDEAEKEFKEGRTVSHEQLKKDVSHWC